MFKVTTRVRGQCKGPLGAFVTYCDSSCCFFLSKTVVLLETKYSVKDFGSTEMKIDTNGLGHMTKVATVPMYGKTLQIFSSRTRGPLQYLEVVEQRIGTTGLGHMTKMVTIPIYMYCKNL